MNNLKLDSRGLEQLKQELIKKREELAQIRMYKGKVAIYQGDNWHDNPELYQTELSEMGLMKEIQELQSKINSAEIIEKKENSEEIDIDDIFKFDLYFNDELDEEDGCYRLITGNPNRSAEVEELSVNSPMGNAVYGCKKNEWAYYEVQQNALKVFIKEIYKREEQLNLKIKKGN